MASMSLVVVGPPLFLTTWKSLFVSPGMLRLGAHLVKSLDGEYFDWQLFAGPIFCICPRALVFSLPLMMLLAVEVPPLIILL